MSTNDYLEQLGRAHGFTLDELRANRAGALHPAQLARGLRAGKVGVTTLVVLGVLALCGGLGGAYAFHDSLGATPSDTDLNGVYAIAGAGVAFAFAFLFGAWKSRSRQRTRQAAFARQRVDVLEGPVQKTHIRGRRGIQDRYYLRVGHRSFETFEPLWELLTQGATYRLHCVHDQLLSLEPVVDLAPGA